MLMRVIVFIQARLLSSHMYHTQVQTKEDFSKKAHKMTKYSRLIEILGNLASPLATSLLGHWMKMILKNSRLSFGSFNNLCDPRLNKDFISIDNLIR